MRTKITDASQLTGLLATYRGMHVDLSREQKAALRQKFIDGEPTREDCELLVRSNIMWVVNQLTNFAVNIQVDDLDDFIAAGISHAWQVAKKYHGGFAATTFYGRVMYNWGRRYIGQITSQSPVAIPVSCAQKMTWLHQADPGWLDTEESAVAAANSTVFRQKSRPNLSDKAVLRLRAAIRSSNTALPATFSRTYRDQQRADLRLTYGTDDVSTLLADIVQQAMWSVALKSDRQRVAMGVLSLRLKDWTLQRIGDQYKLSKERIRQINHYGRLQLADEILTKHGSQVSELLPYIGVEFDGPRKSHPVFCETQ